MSNSKNDRFIKKYLAIQKAFKHKYNVEGKRSSVIYSELEAEFFLSPSRLQEIVGMDLNKPERWTEK